MNPTHEATIAELRRLAKHEVTHHATSPGVVLRVIEELMEENKTIRSDRDTLDGVMHDTAEELGCECDNEEILLAIDELKEERDRAMVHLGHAYNFFSFSDDSCEYYDVKWLRKHGCRDKGDDYEQDCVDNLNFAIAVYELVEVESEENDGSN